MNSFYLAQGGSIGPILSLVISIAILIGVGKVFVKAGKPGWACIVPFYNMVVMTEIAGKPILWFFLLFVPFVNIYISIVLIIEIAKRFGKETGFALGLIFLSPIFWCILGYGDAVYQPVETATPETT